MSAKIYLSLFALSIAATLLIAHFQPFPGYLDSDYYYAGGMQLAQGKGFSEPYLWNYLDGTISLPHPSHSYWMPLASIVAAMGMWLIGDLTYESARIFFILFAGLSAPLTAMLAYKFSGKTAPALASGLLAVFSVYHAPFLGVTDNFSLSIILGGLYFFILSDLKNAPEQIAGWVGLGFTAGLLSLSRSDGLLWLVFGFLFIWLLRQRQEEPFGVMELLGKSTLILVGFLVIMIPWYARNLAEFGAIMGPGGSRTLWLDHYDQTFIYPPSQLTLETFLALGWREILSDRIWALGLNLQSGFAAHGGIILFPFIVAGVLLYRSDVRVRLAGLAWLALLVVMTVLFPFAGARGAFFHAGAALQPMWWTLAPLGLDALLLVLRKRGWGDDRTVVIFRSALVMIALILTAFVVYLRLFALGWGEGEDHYPVVEQYLVGQGAEPQDIVMVRNAPGYYIGTGRSAISIPYGDAQTIQSVAELFDAAYLVLEPEAVLRPIESLFERPESLSAFQYLGEVDGSRIYKINEE